MDKARYLKFIIKNVVTKHSDDIKIKYWRYPTNWSKWLKQKLFSNAANNHVLAHKGENQSSFKKFSKMKLRTTTKNHFCIMSFLKGSYI